MEKSGKSQKRLRAARDLNRVVAEFYLEGHDAKARGRPVGWIPPMNGAIEVFYAMGIQPVFPENWSPVCAAFGLAPRNFEVAEALGFSRDLCGYLRNIVGYVHGPMNGEGVPLGGLPEPDLIVSPYGGCVPAMKIFHSLERRFPKARIFTSQLPQVGYENIRPYHLEFAVSEMRRLISWLSEVTGLELDEERLREVVRLSDRACELWDEIMSFRRFVPTPISAAELGVMFVMVTRQGTQVAVDFLTRLRDEVRERAEQGVGVIEPERIRLFWDNIPLWYNMGLFNAFEDRGAVFVAETYSAAWSMRLDPRKPIESLALKSLVSYPMASCTSIRKRQEMVLKACRDYRIDGAVLHSNKSCVPITLGQMDIKRALEEQLGIPSVVVDGDHMDDRNFSVGQFRTRVEAFLEMLLEQKERCRRRSGAV
jgi:benzoyl-CoA reductase/2-hydroxyglutaryl-CoA dehydratase subunit BcrC/BadD/HgdB